MKNTKIKLLIQKLKSISIKKKKENELSFEEWSKEINVLFYQIKSYGQRYKKFFLAYKNNEDFEYHKQELLSSPKFKNSFSDDNYFDYNLDKIKKNSDYYFDVFGNNKSPKTEKEAKQMAYELFKKGITTNK